MQTTFSKIVQGQGFDCQQTALTLQDIQKLSNEEVQNLTKDQVKDINPVVKQELAKKLPLQDSWSFHPKNVDNGPGTKMGTIDTISTMWEGIITTWKTLSSESNSMIFFRDTNKMPPRHRLKGHGRNLTRPTSITYIWGGHIKDHLVNLNNGILLTIVLGIFGGDGFKKINSIIDSFEISFAEKKFTISISDRTKKDDVDDEICELLNNEYGDYAIPYPEGNIGFSWVFGRPGHLNDDNKWISAQDIAEVDTWQDLIKVWDNEGFGNLNNQVFKGMKPLTFFASGLAPSYEILGDKLGISSGKIMHMKWPFGKDENGDAYPRLNMKLIYWHILRYMIENEDKSIFGVDLRNNDARFWIAKYVNHEELHEKISNYLGNAINHKIYPREFDAEKELKDWNL